jgi:hypothetical protein
VLTRLILVLAVFCAVSFAGEVKAPETAAVTLRGKLVVRANPALETSEHKLVVLGGDASTEHVLRDKRLAGMEMEAKGHFTAADHFQVDPFYTHALHVIKDGKRLRITYWCDVCSIRQYEPGPCWCCQRETALALKPDDE